MKKLYLVSEEIREPIINWIILKRKIDPNTQTEIIMKLNGKERHLFMIKINEQEEEITHLFNVYDKRVFENVFWWLKKKTY